MMVSNPEHTPRRIRAMAWTPATWPPATWPPATWPPAITDRWYARFRRLYGPSAETWFPRLLRRLELGAAAPPDSAAPRWDQRDVALITYGDQVRGEQGSPLRALDAFLSDYGLDERINTIHVLPFCPSSSDDGFSVIDYRRVDPAIGTWDDFAHLGARRHLMYDLVLNHVSRDSEWFRGYVAGDPRFAEFFTEADPAWDLSAVVRPRSLPLLSPIATSRGPRHLWTTFSADQIDLNYAHPGVLIEILELLLFYVRQGARFIRLDAVAFIWKEIGTRCIHLDQAHEIVKLMRDVVAVLAPQVVLLTETNVPHAENVSYFGQGDEAHMVYQFSLPPLLLDALLHHDARPLRRWLSRLEEPLPGTTFFNFTASHDGIGVRPLEGLVSQERFDALVRHVRAIGGLVSTRRCADGSDAPYELNTTYWNAVGEPGGGAFETQLRKFLASQAIMLSLRGIPGVYFHSLLGTGNDLAAAQASGIPRRINRRKFTRAELDSLLANPTGLARAVLRGYQHLLETRVQQPAFHPEGGQMIWPYDHPAVLAFLRTSPDGTQQILVVGNLSPTPHRLDLSSASTIRVRRDLLRPDTPPDKDLTLAPFQVSWLDLEPRSTPTSPPAKDG
jgi:glycosidase